MNIEIVLFAAGRDTEPPTDRQRLRMTVRPGDIAEVRIRRRRGRRLELDRRGRRVVLRLRLGAGQRLLDLRVRLAVPLLLPRRHRVRVIQPLAVDLTGVLLLQLFYRLEQVQARHGGSLYLLIAPDRDGRLRRMTVRPR